MNNALSQRLCIVLYTLAPIQFDRIFLIMIIFRLLSSGHCSLSYLIIKQCGNLPVVKYLNMNVKFQNTEI